MLIKIIKLYMQFFYAQAEPAPNFMLGEGRSKATKMKYIQV
jgi:hypothetical protein